MKVLRPGRQVVEWSREVTCTGDGNGRRGCQALLSINKDDLFKTTGQGIVWFATFKCPECGEMTDIEALGDRPATVPVDIQVNLMPRLAWEAKQVERAAQQRADAMVAGYLPRDDGLKPPMKLPPVVSTRVKPTDCTCDYPRVVCRNICGHPQSCPSYRRWYQEAFGKRMTAELPATTPVTLGQNTNTFRCHRCGSTAPEGNPYCIHCDLGAK